MGNIIKYLDKTFDESAIKSGNPYYARSLLSSSLEIDTFSFEVTSDDTTLTQFQRNTPLTYFHDDTQMGTFYVQKISRENINTYRFDCTSTVGLLDESYHNGGIYTGQTVDEVVTDICSPYLAIVKNNIKSIKLYGWLPIATKRENLTQVLFAIGATLKVDYNGVIRIEGLWDSQSAEIDADHMYSGGSVEYATPVTQVIVTEHAYNQTATETVDLFEGTASAGDKITFDEPCYDLVADGFSITESGANYAIVTAGSGKLTGKKYVHTTRQVIKDIAPKTRDLIDQSDSVVKVEGATLVSLANSNAVAERLVSYYSCNERIVSDVLVQSESPGDVVSIVHPYGGTVEGCIESSDITMSKKLKSNESVLVGYKPQNIGDVEYYDKSEILTASGNWTVPDNVTSVRAVLISGGQGGLTGEKGEDGKQSNQGGTGGAGGKGGEGGNGGRILQSTLNVNPGDTFAVSIGTGGAAGVNGTDTTFGSLSTASGSSSPNGFTDPFTEVTYAAKGKNGMEGGKGGDGTKSETATRASNGADVLSFIGGQGGNYEYKKRESGTHAGKSGYAGGGGGGGAANGGNGEDGNDGMVDWLDDITGNGPGYHCIGGAGGDGGAANIPPEKESVPGQGGTGGAGGGGGGGGGYPRGTVPSADWVGTGGSGGSGGPGGAAGDGCVILYYSQPKEGSLGGAVKDKNGKIILDKYARKLVV